MDPQRYAQVKEIFREAIRWAPEARAEVVAILANDDDVVRDEVLSLLAHHHEGPLIRGPAPGGGAPGLVVTRAPALPDPLDALGVVLDRHYRVDALVHAGRHRSVYRAEHVLEGRPVALKLFPPDDVIDGEALLAELASRASAIVSAAAAAIRASARAREVSPAACQ